MGTKTNATEYYQDDLSYSLDTHTYGGGGAYIINDMLTFQFGLFNTEYQDNTYPKVDDGTGIFSTHLHTDGANGDKLLMPGGGSATTPISNESVKKKLHNLRMIEASSSFKVAVNRFSEACEEAIEANNITMDDISLIVPHQANLRILQAMAKKLNVPTEKVYLTIEKYGNMSSATVPVALDEAVREGKIKKGDFVLLTAFGGGLTWGSALIKWSY